MMLLADDNAQVWLNVPKSTLVIYVLGGITGGYVIGRAAYDFVKYLIGWRRGILVEKIGADEVVQIARIESEKRIAAARADNKTLAQAIQQQADPTTPPGALTPDLKAKIDEIADKPFDPPPMQVRT